MNKKLGNGTPTVNNGTYQWGTPIIQPQDLPVLPSFQCNNDDKVVADNGSLDLQPGVYGNIKPRRFCPGATSGTIVELLLRRVKTIGRSRLVRSATWPGVISACMLAVSRL